MEIDLLKLICSQLVKWINKILKAMALPSFLLFGSSFLVSCLIWFSFLFFFLSLYVFFWGVPGFLWVQLLLSTEAKESQQIRELWTKADSSIKQQHKFLSAWYVCFSLYCNSSYHFYDHNFCFLWLYFCFWGWRPTFLFFSVGTFSFFFRFPLLCPPSLCFLTLFFLGVQAFCLFTRFF